MDPSSSYIIFNTVFLQANLDGWFWLSASLMLILLVCSALISGSEVAFFSIGPSELEELNNSQNSRHKLILELLNKPSKEEASRKLLATILVANNFINVAIIMISTLVIDPLFEGTSNPVVQLLVQVVLVTFLLVLFGEVIPKIYATSNSISLASLMAKPLGVLEKAFFFISRPLIKLTELIDRRKHTKINNLSVDELSQALELTKDDQRTEGEHKILEGIIYFGTKDVKQVMTSRVEIEALEYKFEFKDILTKVTSIGFSRIPVYSESLDSIKGILYLKDLLPYIHRKNYDWSKLIRTPFFVPENKKIDDLLREFQEKKIHMAVVVDEYGGTSGIVTLEDIIEEIVGDITDEFDDENLIYSKLDNHNYVFEGKTALIDIYRILEMDGSEMESSKGDSDSLAGFVIEQAGKIPLKNEKIVFSNLTFTVEAADKRKVKRVKITIDEN